MRLVGLAERALQMMVRRLSSRVAFGSEIARQTVWQERIAESRCLIEQARLLVLKAAYLMDTSGNKVARKEIAMIKVVAPNVACKVIDWAIQAYGGAGVNDDFLAGAYASARSLRLADGPDESIATRSPAWSRASHAGEVAPAAPAGRLLSGREPRRREAHATLEGRRHFD
jgi:acyl-CoA dehydrogenase